MQKYLLLVVLLLGFSFTIAQAQTIDIQGIALDTLEQPLVGATVLLKGQDDVMKAFGLTNDKGQFELTTEMTQSAVLQITYIGYGTFERSLNASKTNIDLGEIILNPIAVDLKEVVVEDSFIPIVIKKDTIEYNADAFQTRPNATVEDLLKRLPGIEVEKDGTIKAQGEEVKNVLVDGKEFFEDAPKVATQNIPAEVVDKVQVFDKASDLAAFTGIEDGNEEKTINLAIKEGKNKGWFGNVEASYGLDDNYKSGGLVNRFNDKMQLSLLGNANNINEQAFTLEDYLKYSGQLEEVMETGQLDIEDIPVSLLNSNGVNSVAIGGINFNYDFSEKTTLRSNYYFNNTRNITLSQSQNELLNEEDQFTQIATTDNNSTLKNHNARIKLKHQFDPTAQLSVETRLSSNSTLLDNESEQQSFVNSSALRNAANQVIDTDLSLLNWSLNAAFQKKFQKLGRYFTAAIETRQANQNSTANLNNQLTFFADQPPIVDTILQQQHAERTSPTYKLELTYSEPIGKANYWQLKSSYQNDASTKEKLFFDGSNAILNQALSNTFLRDLHKAALSTVYKSVRPNFNWTIGLDYEYALLQGGISSSENLNESFNFLLPNAFFTYKFSGAKQFRVNYRTRSNIPSVEQLQPVIDNSNPLSIVTGNPDLRPEYIHQLNFNFTSFNQFYLRSLFVGGNLNWTQHKIISLTAIDDNLSAVLLPINSDPALNVSLYGSFDTPVKNWNFKIGFDENLTFNQSPIAINALEDTYRLLNLDQTITLENKKKEVLDWQVSYTLAWNRIDYEQSKAFNRQFFVHTYLFDLNWLITDAWNFDIAVEHIQYPEIDFSDRQRFTFLDATLNKSFKEEQFSVYLKAQNLLNVKNRLERTAFANQFLENTSNRVGRVVLLGVVYKLRQFGK